MPTTQSDLPPISTVTGFLLGGLAACCAVTVSNPAEVAKTRLQLQGELTRNTTNKVYRNTLDAMAKITKHEGIRGLQRGLGAAYIYQILVNGSRLGFYEPLRRTINGFARLDPGEQNAATSVLAGAASGAIGACVSSPLFLVKARMQAFSPSLPIGTQHHYKNTFHALVSVVRTDGLQGLGRGMNASILRTTMGSSVQVPSFIWTKNQLVSRDLMNADSFSTSFVSSCVAGLVILAFMQPFDTVLTRCYVQPVTTSPSGRRIGALYRGPFHALAKIIRYEGPLALYKGSTAHFFRITPHTIITLTANDLLRQLYQDFLRSRHPY